MKIIFLDVDDVICTQRYNIISEEPWKDFDPVACKLVEKLCQETGAKIALSSSWGVYDFTYQKFLDSINKACPSLKEYFLEKDFRVLLERVGNQDRATVICNWLKKHPEVSNFVILDDTASFTYSAVSMEKLENNLILCMEFDGIGFREYHIALDILGKHD